MATTLLNLAYNGKNEDNLEEKVEKIMEKYDL